MSDENSVYSRGGFSGVPGELEVYVARKTQARKESAMNDEVRRRRAEELSVAKAMRIATVPMEGWEAEKVARVKNAFDRIIDRGWIDKSELTLEEHELNHINAVREHFGMQRDKIQTPSMTGGPGSNRLDLLDWTDNVYALDELKETSGVQEGFHALVKRAGRARERRERAKLEQDARQKETAKAILDDHVGQYKDLYWVP